MKFLSQNNVSDFKLISGGGFFDDEVGLDFDVALVVEVDADRELRGDFRLKNFDRKLIGHFRLKIFCRKLDRFGLDGEREAVGALAVVLEVLLPAEHLFAEVALVRKDAWTEKKQNI